LDKDFSNIDEIQQVAFSNENVERQSEVYTCGFGYFNNLRGPSIYKGYVTSVVKKSGKALFIQHTARTYRGQSGGALLNAKFELLGLIFKNSIINIKNTNIKK